MSELTTAAKELLSRIREGFLLTEPTILLLTQVLQHREDENLIQALALVQCDAIVSALFSVIMNQEREMMAKKEGKGRRLLKKETEEQKRKRKEGSTDKIGVEKSEIAEEEEQWKEGRGKDGREGVGHELGVEQVSDSVSGARFLSFALCFLADLVYLSPALAQSLGTQSLLSSSASSSDQTSSPTMDFPPSQFVDIAINHGEIEGILHPALYVAAVALRYTPLDGATSSQKDAVESCVLSFLTIAQQALNKKILEVEHQAFIIRACVQLARSKALRVYLLHNGIIQYIPRLLTEIVSSSTSSMLQLIYDSLLLAWLLSYEYEGVVQLYQSRMIPHLLRVLQRIQKEKCLRVTLMIFSNMVNAEKAYLYNASHPAMDSTWVDEKLYVLSQLRQLSSHNHTSGSSSGGGGGRGDGVGGVLKGSSTGGGKGDLISTAALGTTTVTAAVMATGGSQYSRQGSVLVGEMVGVGTLKTLLALKRRKFGDEDIPSLLQRLITTLEESMELITSFSEYRGEVLSGTLDWTPVHTSSKFWQENHLQMETNNYEVLQALGKIILETTDERSLAVACHDLGELVRYHPTGRSLLSLPAMDGVKERVIRLMFDQHSEVSKEALLCTQKIMVQQWEYV